MNPFNIHTFNYMQLVPKKYTNLKFKYFIIKYILYFYFSIDYYTFQGFFKIYFDKIINILHCFQVSNWCTFLKPDFYFQLPAFLLCFSQKRSTS